MPAHFKTSGLAQPSLPKTSGSDARTHTAVSPYRWPCPARLPQFLNVSWTLLPGRQLHFVGFKA